MGKRNLIDIVNIGPIEEAKIDINNLTVLIGPNNSGKSYAILLYHSLIKGLNVLLDQFQARILKKLYEDKFNGKFKAIKKDEEKNLFEFIIEFFWFIIEEFVSSDIASKTEIPQLNKNELKFFKKDGTLKEDPDTILKILANEIDEVWQSLINEKQNVAEIFYNSLYKTFRLEPNHLISWGSNENKSLIKLYYDDYILQIELFPHSKVTDTLKVNISYPSENWRRHIINAINEIIKYKRGYTLFFEEALDGILFEEHRTSNGKSLIYNTMRTFILRNFITSLRNELVLTLVIPAGRGALIRAHDVLTSAIIKQSTTIGLEEASFPGLMEPIASFLIDLINAKDKLKEHESSKIKASREIGKILLDFDKSLLKGKISFVDDKDLLSSLGKAIYYEPSNTNEKIPLRNASSAIGELSGLRLFLESHLNELHNSIIIIEEPEAHLHPEMQIKFVNNLIDLSKYVKGIIITTHSDYITQGINIRILEDTVNNLKVSKKELKEKQPFYKKVSVYWMKFNGNNQSITQKIAVEPDGLQPETFLDVIDELGNKTSYLLSKIDNYKEEQ
ncbi:MAG: AAA family ATPase [Candidatus Heimdallarchaeum endolithica]|uniref:AAA family ATPase n=1 Tax=Candidatus Heimdallarchaeum endolithica TaxID=2876572 RepID=A0A9Y1BSS6_9ARCH|nr:MAG: AAA family ATPase [Candidatus Heimdallarchaeum endolithica]